MFPIISYNYYLSNAINLININYLHKKLSFKIIYTKKNLLIIKFFKKISFIDDYLIIKKNKKPFIVVKLLYFKNLQLIKNFKLISTPSRTYYISFKALTLLNKRSGTSVYILSTSNGIITHKEALKKNLSGFLLGFFYN